MVTNMRRSKTQHQRVSFCGVLFILCLLSGSEGQNQTTCKCPAATILHQFPSHFPNNTCCLNFTGSSFGNLSWAALDSIAELEILDLSFCNITHIVNNVNNVNFTFSSLRELYLDHNQLTSVPSNFLANAYSLEVLDLRGNLLENLPVDFLQNSKSLRVLLLNGNNLQFLPSSVYKPSITQLDLMDNPWSCTCALVEELQKVQQGNDTSLVDIVGNLTCASPPGLAGKSVWSVDVKEICPLVPASLSALFILLPLFFLLVLVLCWCCGKKGKKKESSTYRSCKQNNHVLRNGRRPQDKLPFGEKTTTEVSTKNQLMLRPSSALLGSTRDIYEEVEVKLGSVDSLGPPPSASSAEGIVGKKEEKEEKEEMDSKQDLETVSVTEVMKDSTDREKAYMIQSTKYYSLVPGLEIEDSDHGDYESVDLS